MPNVDRSRPESSPAPDPKPTRGALSLGVARALAARLRGGLFGGGGLAAAVRTVARRIGIGRGARCRVCGLPRLAGPRTDRRHPTRVRPAVGAARGSVPTQICAWRSSAVAPSVCPVCLHWARHLDGTPAPTTAHAGLRSTTTLGIYAGDLRRAVLALKAGDAVVASALGHALGRCWRTNAAGAARAAVAGRTRGDAHAPTLVTWVPSPWHRRLARGYTPSRRLAAAVAAEARLPLRRLLAAARRPRARQSQLGRAERQRNVRGAFGARGPIAAVVLVVDDVVTTGATAEACAAALRSAGATDVHLLAVARTASRRADRAAPSDRRRGTRGRSAAPGAPERAHREGRPKRV